MLLFIRKSLFCALCLSLSACSVVMASMSGGVNPKKLSQCHTRSCLIAAGATPISKQNGGETFRATMPTGSAARAAMHGVLDVGTLGLWEVAGTPIEAVKGKKTGYVINVKYAEDGNSIKHMAFEF